MLLPRRKPMLPEASHDLDQDWNSCPEGSFWSNHYLRCLPCEENCLKCTGKGQCTQCAVPYTLTDKQTCRCDYGYRNKHNACVVCGQDDFFYDGNDCQKCSERCVSCDSPTGRCTECEAGFQINERGECACSTGYYLNYGICFKATRSC